MTTPLSPCTPPNARMTAPDCPPLQRHRIIPFNLAPADESPTQFPTTPLRQRVLPNAREISPAVSQIGQALLPSRTATWHTIDGRPATPNGTTEVYNDGPLCPPESPLR